MRVVEAWWIRIVQTLDRGEKFDSKQNILSMATMYPNLLQIVTLKKSGITNVEEIKGSNISTGSPGSGTNFMAETTIKALGIPLDSYNDSRLSFTETANALRDGTIDVGFWSVGPPTSSIMDLATTHDIHIISLTPEQTAKVLAANETYSSVDLKGGTYNGVDDAVSTIGVWNVMICQASLETDMVYNLAKDVHYLAISVDTNMTTLAGNMQNVSENMSQLTANIRAMTVTMDSIDNKVATLEPMLANLDSMDGSIQSMTYATHNMGRSTQYMQTDISRMNHNIGRPMSFMNAFMPW